MEIKLHSRDLLLRALEPDDLPYFMRVENDPQLWSVCDTRIPFSRFTLERVLEARVPDFFADRQLRLMIENGNRQVVGIVDLCSFDPLHNRAEVGIMVDKSCRRQGIGRNALALLEEHCFRYLGIHQLFAYIAVENLPSRRLFAACGYKESAVLKEWAHTFGGGYTDVLVVQKLNLS